MAICTDPAPDVPERPRLQRYSIAAVWHRTAGRARPRWQEHRAARTTRPDTHYFEDEGTKTYVITKVLTSSSIVVNATNEDEKAVSVDVPASAQALGAKVTVRSDTASAREVTYTGSPVAFGFKAFGIAYVNGGWRIHGVKPGADLAFAATAGVDVVGVMPTGDRFTVVERGQAVHALVLERRLIDWR